MEPEAENDVLGLQVGARGDRGDRFAQGTGGCDAAVRGSGLRAGCFREEERTDTVADVAPDQAAGVDDALVRSPDQAAPEREVARSRQAPGKRRGSFEVREKDRRRPSVRLRDQAHSRDVPEVGGERHRGEHRHAGGGLGDQRGAGKPAVDVAEAEGDDGDVARPDDPGPLRGE